MAVHDLKQRDISGSFQDASRSIRCLVFIEMEVRVVPAHLQKTPRSGSWIDRK